MENFNGSHNDDNEDTSCPPLAGEEQQQEEESKDRINNDVEDIASAAVLEVVDDVTEQEVEEVNRPDAATTNVATKEGPMVALLSTATATAAAAAAATVGAPDNKQDTREFHAARQSMEDMEMGVRKQKGLSNLPPSPPTEVLSTTDTAATTPQNPTVLPGAIRIQTTNDGTGDNGGGDSSFLYDTTTTIVPPANEAARQGGGPSMSSSSSPPVDSVAAGGGGDYVMLTAERVEPPIEAVQVIFDEDNGHDPLESTATNAGRHGTIHNNSDDNHNNQNNGDSSVNHNDDAKNDCRCCNKWTLPVVLVLPILLTVIILLVIVAPGLVRVGTNENLNPNEPEIVVATSGGLVNDNNVTIPIVPPSDYDYECFVSTPAVLQAQIDHPNQTIFILCPNNMIPIGKLAHHDLEWVDGELPLMAMRSNIEIRCGLDGSVTNNCILLGGYLQILLAQLLPSIDDNIGIESNRTDNVTIRGITFRGQIHSDYVFGGGSVIVSNPGKKVQLIDCLWEDMATNSGLIYVGNDRFTSFSGRYLMENQVAQLEIINSTFRNITYDGPLTFVWNQQLSLIGCHFENIRLSRFLSKSSCDIIDRRQTWCQTIMFCLDDSYCHIKDLCLENFQYAAYGSILAVHNESQLELVGTNYGHRVRPHEVFVTNLDNNTTTNGICESGIVRVDKLDGTPSACITSSEGNTTIVEWQSSNRCML